MSRIACRIEPAKLHWRAPASPPPPQQMLGAGMPVALVSQHTSERHLAAVSANAWQMKLKSKFVVWPAAGEARSFIQKLTAEQTAANVGMSSKQLHRTRGAARRTWRWRALRGVSSSSDHPPSEDGARGRHQRRQRRQRIGQQDGACRKATHELVR